MTSNLIDGLTARSVEESLTELDACTKDSNKIRNGAVGVGPFNVFSLSDRPSPNQVEANIFAQDEDLPVDFPTAPVSDPDSILDIGNALGWNDLFGTGLDFASSGQNEQIYEDPLTLLDRVANQPAGFPQPFQQSDDFPSLGAGALMEPGTGNAHPMNALTVMTDTELLSYGGVLLKHFKDAVIPTYSPLPTNSRSPWEIMNCCAAVQTLADLTFLQAPDVKHANKANLYGTLACSAYTIAKTQQDYINLSFTKCEQIGDYAGRRAKKNLQDSLRSETSGPQKAKYKDQLMAVNTLIALAV